MVNAVLRSTDFVRSDGSLLPGLVPVSGDALRDTSLSVQEQASIHDALAFEHIDFIFFRRFSDGRSPTIAAYIIDNADHHLDEQELAKLHSKLWLQGTVPLLYVAWPGRIDVLSCVRGPDFWQRDELAYMPAERIATDALGDAASIARELRRFSAFRHADGTFWEAPENGELADYRKASHQALIDSVVDTDKELDGENNPLLRRLLLLMMLVKYLEDRGVFRQPGLGWFGRWHKGAKSFKDVLNSRDPDKVRRLLQFLEAKFNGDVFALPLEQEEQLTEAALGRFHDLVEARTIGKQRYLWEQYSFAHLPVETISHLYQRFAGKGRGAVYTPPFLAALLLDYAMPYEKLAGNERVLDPACGSGIFLVGAFRRLVNVWRSKHRWERPDVDTLKGILGQSIHGIELDAFSIDLTAFSLSLAICEALRPEVIWRDLRFECLRNHNLSEGDFFSHILGEHRSDMSLQGGRFDVILGNPPFMSELTDAGRRVDVEAQRSNEERGSVPDKQAAYLFLEQALGLLSRSGLLCLIQPSSFLYNKNPHRFRTALFRRHKIETILDFTSIRNLYEVSDPKTIAVSARAVSPGDEHTVNHWTFRRTVSAKERVFFELDGYDRHRVPQEAAEQDPYVWRIGLLGGGRLADLSRRLRDFQRLKEYVELRGWDYGEGFNGGDSKGGRTAPHLTGKPLLPTEAFGRDGIDRTAAAGLRVTETHFKSPQTEERFTAPLLLIKETDSLPVAFWNDGPLAYRHSIVGIHAPREQADQLRALGDLLERNHRSLRFSCMLHSNRLLVNKSTAVLKADIGALPIFDDESGQFSFWEQALQDDVLDYMGDYVRLGQNSELLGRSASAEELNAYSSLFVRMLGSIYDNLRPLEPLLMDGLICQPFCFGERPGLRVLESGREQDLRDLIYDEDKHACLRTVRVLRYYAENVLLIVKPDRLRYWIGSTAIRDADDTLVDLRRQGF